MDDLAILHALADASEGQDPTLRPDIVRFQLEVKHNGADLRAGIEAIVQSKNFSLAPLDAMLPAFHVLQFPGVARTIAPDRLFAIADRLVEALDLVSCTPDIGTSFYAEPDVRLLRPRAPESAALDLLCWSKAAAPLDPHWSVKAVKAPQAWTLSPKQGAGVIIAQPDTGVASHPDLDRAALRLDLARNILDGSNDPTDPLDKAVSNPGHGTATGSVVVSRSEGKMVGSAPAASLVPIRCVTDVKIFDGTPVAAAILHAVRIKADIITMSLGGIYSRSISAAIGVAIDNGIIVMAAAGNCVGFVVYPASDDRVIGVAGVDVNDRPWKGTSAGPSVTIAAPAENVYVARRTPGDGGGDLVNGGQGTSFAVATTAGVAALWIAKFGHQPIRDEANRRGVSVQDLFRTALETTARRPQRWNSWLHGAGIVDAEALLRLDLGDIPGRPMASASPESVPNAPSSSPVARIFDDAQAQRSGPVDWARHGAEATFLAADAWRRRDGGRTVLLETPARPKPSPGLQAGAEEVVRVCDAMAGQAPALASPLPPSRLIGVGRNTPGIIAPKTGGKESSLADARNTLSGMDLRDFQDMVEAKLSAIDSSPTASLEAAGLRRDVMNRTESAVRDMLRVGEEALPPQSRFVLEALVRLTGRPAFKVNDSKLSDDQVNPSEWRGVMTGALPYVEALVKGVGRIDLDGDHVGTGFVVGAGLVMTNRHVAEAIADAVAGPAGAPQWFLRDNVTINFDDRGRGNLLRFKVRSIVSAGPDKIANVVDFAHLDMAILDVETKNDALRDLPKALSLVGDAVEGETKQDIAIIGYPARPDPAALDDPSGQNSSEAIASRLAVLFGVDYGRKYFSPGRIDVIAGRFPDDPSRWILAHDATTLGGCSGSPTIRFADGLPVLGLHFAGVPMTANYAHSLAAVRASTSVQLPAGLHWV